MKLKNKQILDELRKFYFRHQWTHKEVQQYLRDHYGIDLSTRTLKRWKQSLVKDPFWSGPCQPSAVPVTKVLRCHIERIIRFREKTGYGPLILKHVFPFGFSESTYKRIIKANGLSRGSKMENIRVHWVKWQREHPDSLWQLDGSQNEDGTWTLPVIDDCSRYCIGIKKVMTQTTAEITAFLEELFKIHGIPREILTDNGSEFGGTSKNSEFDEWCERWRIKHIRSRIHKPTTVGKVERHHLTLQQEISFCKGDLELFRYRYNHIRPHRSLNMKTPAQVYFDLQKRIKMSEPKPQERW